MNVKETGERCRKKARQHYDYCERHKAMDDPHKQPPKKLQAMFEQSMGRMKANYRKALANPSIFALEPVLALYDMRMDELAARIDQGDTSDFRYRVKTLYEQYIDGIASGNDDKAERALREMGDLIKTGAEYDATWEKLLEKADRRSTIDLALKKESILTEREYQQRLGKILDILIQELPREQTQIIITRIGREAMEDGGGGTLLEIGEGEGSAVCPVRDEPDRVLQRRAGVDAVGEATRNHA
jgi:hypothetical protein